MRAVNGKILFVSPGYFRGDDAPHMQRDAFRYVQYLERTGRSARLLLLSEPTCLKKPSDPRLAAAPYEKWTDPTFWESFDSDTVMMYSYGGLSPRKMLPVFQAIRDAGARIFFQMDAGLGLPAFPYRCWTMFKRRYWWARWRFRPVVPSVVRASTQILRWAWGDSARFVCRKLLPLCDSIRVESPVARENTRNRLIALGHPETANRVVFAPHPVPEAFAWNGGATTKVKRILCVARDWRSPLKGGTLLSKAFSMVLPGTGWKAIVIGDASRDVARRSGLDESVVETRPRLPSELVAALFRESSILVTASGAETGPIVVWEALAAGCSVVFPPELAQLEPLVGWNVATMSRHRSSRSLARALSVEMKAWDAGLRNPDHIAREVGTKALVAELSQSLFRMAPIRRDCNDRAMR